mgnify:CR=1 FL=1
MPLKVIRSEIINLFVEAIVNPTDQFLTGSGSIDMEIQYKCGSKLKKILKEKGKIEVGEAFITDAFNMNCKKIIHVCGPRWIDGRQKEIELLELCYNNALTLAKKENIQSIAFPLISTGTFGFPKDLAVAIATNVFTNFLLENDMEIYLVVYDKESFGVTKKVFDEIKDFISENFIETKELECQRLRRNANYSFSTCYYEENNNNISFEDIALEDTFSVKLLKLIDEKKLTDTIVYKKANIDRKLFSKIRSNVNYNPSKKTAIALGIALELNYDGLQELLSSAGYTLSKSNMFDVIIEGCIKKEIYNIYQINNILFEFDLPILN